MANMYSPVQLLTSGDIVIVEKPDYYVIGRVEPREGGGDSEPFYLDTSVSTGDSDRNAALLAAQRLVGDRSVFLVTIDGAWLQLHPDVKITLPERS
jgi:hypothetical protein